MSETIKNPDTNLPNLTREALDGSHTGLFSASIDTVLSDYPVINLLHDAPSYRKTDESLYLGRSGEELRTAKSISLLRRIAAGDMEGLLGDNAEKLQPGYEIYTDIVANGLRQLGEEDLELGIKRMETVLSVHDIGKSALVAERVQESYGITDHDMALSALIEDNFNALDGYIDSATVTWLRESVIQDPALHNFLGRQRGLDPGFNIGRHLQGESDFELFRSTAHDVNDVSLAEFTLDLLGADGHQFPDGAAKFANIPPAFNGIANGLNKIVESSRNGIDSNNLYSLWEEISYPREELDRLGLSRDDKATRAVTRLAFIGREHQKQNESESHTNIDELRLALGGFDDEARGRVVDLLQDNRGIDLGFAPHVMEAMRQQVGTEQAYINLLSIVNQIGLSEVVAAHHGGVLTINFDNKYDWSRLQMIDKVNVTLSKPDKSGIIDANFSTG